MSMSPHHHQELQGTARRVAKAHGFRQKTERWHQGFQSSLQPSSGNFLAIPHDLAVTVIDNLGNIAVGLARGREHYNTDRFAQEYEATCQERLSPEQVLPVAIMVHNMGIIERFSQKN